MTVVKVPRPLPRGARVKTVNTVGVKKPKDKRTLRFERFVAEAHRLGLRGSEARKYAERATNR